MTRRVDEPVRSLRTDDATFNNVFPAIFEKQFLIVKDEHNTERFFMSTRVADKNDSGPQGESRKESTEIHKKQTLI